MNRAFLFGNLGCDPDLRYTNKTSTPVLSFSMATHDYSKNETGENVCYTEWHNIIVWGKLAEICKVRLKKADRVLVEGTIKTKSYPDSFEI